MTPSSGPIYIRADWNVERTNKIQLLGDLYWSNYNGTDANCDGIGDTAYIIGQDNRDRYPLMNPITLLGPLTRKICLKNLLTGQT